MNDTIIERSQISFHALRAKFHLNHHDHSSKISTESTVQ